MEDVPDAAVQEPTDVVVRVDTTTICGTDLHILQGDVAAVTDGRVLGHEAVGTITAVGDAVKGFRGGPGAGARDHEVRPLRVLPARHAFALPDRRRHRLDLRPPHRRPAGPVRPPAVRLHVAVATPEGVSDEQAIFLADSLPTGYEVGVLAGGVRPGDTVAVVGAGAVGLSAILTTGLWGASKVIAVDTNKFRLTKAIEFGATDAVEVGPGTVAT